MANRTILLLWLLHSLGIFYLLEQPQGSHMEEMPRFVQFWKMNRLYKCRIRMKDSQLPHLPAYLPTYLFIYPNKVE
jgi:hypothetical protein